MSERYIPTQDIKTGFKVVGRLASGIAEEAKPYVKNELGRQVRRIANNFKNRKI